MNTIELPELEMPSCPSNNVAHTNPRGLTEIHVDGVLRGFVIWEPGMQFSVQWGSYPCERIHYLGWRKSRETAHRAALTLIRSLLAQACDAGDARSDF